MKRTLTLMASAILLSALALESTAQGGRRFATPTLNENAKAALITALAGNDGEYAARAEYEAILDKFGTEMLPYAHIIKAEERHIAALEQQCRNFGIPIPADEFYGKVQAPGTLAEAAEAAILAEKANVAMYETLLPRVQGYPSLVRVFTRLQTASAERHLPVLQAAAANGGSVTLETCRQMGYQQQRLGPGAAWQGRGRGGQGVRAGVAWRGGGRGPNAGLCPWRSEQSR